MLAKKKDQQLSSSEYNSSFGQGSRIVNVEKIKEYTDEVAKHAKNCDGSIMLCSESRNKSGVRLYREVFHLSAHCYTGDFSESERSQRVQQVIK